MSSVSDTASAHPIQQAVSDDSLFSKVQNMYSNLVNPPTSSVTPVVTTHYKEQAGVTMLASEWHGKEDIRVVSRPAPDVTDPADAVIKVTNAAICGSDLHMYFNSLSGLGAMLKGDIMGHETMGIVDRIGPDVKNIKVGDRVIVSGAIACMKCKNCQAQRYSLCDYTNPSSSQETVYGHRLSGIFGYSHQTGGFSGGQAEYLRVPLADNNLLPIKNDKLKDDQVLFLSDILCTGYHGTELCQVQEGDVVCIWGCGPVGLLAAMCALKLKKASRVISIDNNETRLAAARKIGAETLNFSEFSSVTDEIAKRVQDGPDCCIDCVGFRYPKTLSTKVQMTLGLETDGCDVVKECITACKKGGKIALIGDYFGLTNGFPIGAMMEKGLTVAGSQVFVQKYWKYLLEQIENGVVDPSQIITDHMKLEDVAAAYKKFAHAQDGCIKVVLQTKFNTQNQNRAA